MNTLKRLLIALTMAMTGAALSTGAYANNHPFTQYRTRSVTVKFNDLDLSRRAGVATLYRRIRRAGHEVCGTRYGTNPVNMLQDFQSWKACYKTALDNAAAKVDNQQLSQMIYAKTHKATARIAEAG